MTTQPNDLSTRIEALTHEINSGSGKRDPYQIMDDCIVCFHDLLRVIAGQADALENSRSGVRLVEYKFEHAGGIFKVANVGVELGTMSWISNVENGLHNAKNGVNEALLTSAPLIETARKLGVL